MPTLDEQFRAFAKKYPTPSSHPNGPTGNGDTSWDQDCAAFVYRFGMFVVGAQAWQDANLVYGPTAWDVARASGPLTSDSTKAPGGAIHWWRSSTLSGKPGHVGVDLDGRGTRLAMATYAADPELAPALGYQSVKGYSDAKTAMKYVGWTLNYGGARYPITAPAGGGGSLIPGEDDMAPRLIRRINESTLEWSLFHPAFRGASDLERGYLVTTDQNVATAWARTWDAGLGNESMVVRSIYVSLQDQARKDHEGWLRGQRAALEGVVIPPSSGGVTPEELQAAVDSILSAVAAVPGATVDEEHRRLSE